MISAAVSCAAFALIGALVVGGVRLLGILVSLFAGVLWPIAVAGILALMLRPLVKTIERRLKGRRRTAARVVAGIMAIVLAVFLLIVVPPAIARILKLIAFVPDVWNDTLVYLGKHYPNGVEKAEKQLQNPTIKSIVDQATQELRSLFKHAVPSLKAAGSGSMGMLGFITRLAVVPIYLFFFLLSRGQPSDSLA